VATRTNHSTNPCLSVSNAGPTWFGPSGWARITGAHASLPRTTAWAGTTAGDIAAGRGVVVAGEYCVVSCAIRFVSPSVGRMNVDWYTAGGTYLSTSQGPIFDVAGSVTSRVVSGAALAPTDAARIQPNVFGIDGSAEITAVLIERFATEAEALAVLDDHATASYYFDGDSDDAAWDGTTGLSSSTLTFDQAPILAAALPGPSANLTPDVTINGVVLAAALASPQAAIGLLVTALYDDSRGRIRISAQGLAPEVVRVVVSHRPVGSSRWAQVRGGRVAVAAGVFVRTVDDYEYSAGASMQYRIQGLSSSEGEPDVIAQTRVVTVDYVLAHSWIKVISSPHMNTRVQLLRDFTGATRRSRVALYDVQGRRDRVAVTDVHTGREMTIRAVTHTLAARDSLDDALGQGRPIFLHTPAAIPVPTMYAAVGDHSWRPAGPASTRSIFDIALIEVAAPPSSVVGVGLTYEVLSAQFATYDDLGEAFERHRLADEADPDEKVQGT